MPVVQGILSPIFGDTRTLILTRPFAELPVNLSCLKLKFCDLFLLSFGILQQNMQILPEIRKIHHVHMDT